jgi:hypothetical protein
MLLASSVCGLFKWRQFEPEVILLAVGWYLRFSRNCSPSGACTPITSPSGGGCRVTPRKWNAVCARSSNRPTTVGGWTKPTSGSRANGATCTARGLFRCDDRLLAFGHWKGQQLLALDGCQPAVLRCCGFLPAERIRRGKHSSARSLGR